MEKLEKHIKDKLEERRLSPSPKTWDSIESSLGIEVRNTNNNKYWYAIAASLIGFLIISVMYFNSQNENRQTIEVVEVEKEPVPIVKEIEHLNRTEVVDANDEIKEQLHEETGVNRKNGNPDKENFTQDNIKVVVVEEVKKERNPINDSSVNSNTQDLLIDKKINEVLATVMNLERKAIQVSDAEVDSLLRAAQQDILKEKLFKDNGKVDAMALLTEVEDEIDQSFRDKIFKKLKDGLFKARTAVADRNN